MQLTVRDAARILNVSEKTIYKWINAGDLPAYKTLDQFHFNRAELLEWAASRHLDTTRRIAVSAEILKNGDDAAAPVTKLSEALEAGGIFHGVRGDDKPSVLRSIVETMRLPQEMDREFLYQVLLAREAMGSTGIGEGIAIPHARNPIVLQVSKPSISLCFLERPIDFDAADGQRVHTLFSLVTPTVRVHLHLLSRLTGGILDPGFKAALARRASREEILGEVRRIEG